jgi:hypothetical protein
MWRHIVWKYNLLYIVHELFEWSYSYLSKIQKHFNSTELYYTGNVYSNCGGQGIGQARNCRYNLTGVTIIFTCKATKDFYILYFSSNIEKSISVQTQFRQKYKLKETTPPPRWDFEPLRPPIRIILVTRLSLYKMCLDWLCIKLKIKLIET